MNENIKIEEITDEQDFNPLVLSLNTSFTQGYFYGEIQKSMGRNVRRFVFTQESLSGDSRGADNGPVAFCQFVKYSLPLGKSYLYAAYGPTVKLPFSESFLKVFKDKMLEVLKEENAIFARLDFMPRVNCENDLKLLNKFFKKAPLCANASASFQPRMEWVIDLEKDEDELLKNMHQKARYNIKLAERKGVEVEIVKKDFKKYLESFYSLLGETGKRGGFSLHPKKYYEKMLEICEAKQNAFFVIARYNDVDLIINFVMHYGNMAIFAFGGSSEEYRNLMPAYLVQWESILESKRVGCKLYSFGNVNTEKYKNNEWEGFSVFKRKFGGGVFEHSEFYDLVSQPFWYRMYNIMKRVRK